MSLKNTQELEEARAEIEKLTALVSDYQVQTKKMNEQIMSLNNENEKLNVENVKLDAENATLVKSLETKCLELLKSKSSPKVVVTAPSTTRPVVSFATSTSPTVSVPVKRASKMSFFDANPALKKELRWEYFWSFIDKWLFPVSVVAVFLYALWRCFV